VADPRDPEAPRGGDGADEPPEPTDPNGTPRPGKPDEPGEPQDPTADQAEMDRRWQEIVADLGPFDDPPGEPPAGLGHPTDGGRWVPAPGSPHGPRPPRGQGPAWGPRDYTVDDEDDGDFIPPDPPALGAGRPAVVLSVLGLVGGPAVLLLAAIFWPSIPGILITILIAAFIAGGVGLFLALPRDEDRNHPWNDDGAQV
jgi:hypothetical protein